MLKAETWAESASKQLILIYLLSPPGETYLGFPPFTRAPLTPASLSPRTNLQLFQNILMVILQEGVTAVFPNYGDIIGLPYIL